MSLLMDCYLDESGTDDQSPTAVVGGLNLYRDSFFYLDVEWSKVLRLHHIERPLHMKEFTPDGRFKDVSTDSRRRLFSDIVKIINEHKAGTLVASLTTAQYQKHFSGLYSRDQMGVYGFCFMLAAMMQSKSLRMGGYEEKVPYVLDDGNTYRTHVVDAHLSLLELQKAQFMCAGALRFDSDTNVRALQAADVVAWSARRRLTKPFPPGFEPLPELFVPPHNEMAFDEELLAETAGVITALIERKKQLLKEA